MKMIKRFFIIFLILCSIIGVIYAYNKVNADEVITGFEETDLVILNNELEEMRYDIRDLKARVYALENP